MRIGIMSAMIEENLLLTQKLQFPKVFSNAGRTYSMGNYLGHEVVVSFSRWGKVASSITATYLINHFKIDALIFTGVAGACKSNLKIGDIVISDSLVQHDMDARPFFRRFQIPLTDQEAFKAPAALKDQSFIAASKFLTDRSSYILQETLNEFKILNPIVHVGKVASGDKFFGSKDDLRNLVTMIPDALCVEMEGASCAQVCHEHDIPYTIIRTISDQADETAGVDFEKFVNAIASPYSLGIIEKLLPELR